MSRLSKILAHTAQWPLAAGIFAVQLLHHTAAFFAWIWLALHVVFPTVTAGLSVAKIWTEAARYLSDGTLHWRGLLASALIPGLLVALRQAAYSVKQLRPRRDHESHVGVLSRLLKWPTIIGSFAVSLAHHTAGFFAWMWLLFALIGNMGQIGFHLTALGEHALSYFKDRDANYWQSILAVAVLPALIIAIWNARRSYRAIHVRAHDHRHAGEQTP